MSKHKAEAQSPVKSKLPPLDVQRIKYAHLRYKIIPFIQDKDMLELFMKDLDLPRNTTYSVLTKKEEEVCMFPNGGMTVAFKINPETNEVEAGLSKCNIDDVYNKDDGRRIAEGRFLNAKHSHIRFPSLITFSIDDAKKIEIDVGDRPLTYVAREMLVMSINSGSIKDVNADMSFIRAFVASKTRIPFLVELS